MQKQQITKYNNKAQNTTAKQRRHKNRSCFDEFSVCLLNRKEIFAPCLWTVQDGLFWKCLAHFNVTKCSAMFIKISFNGGQARITGSALVLKSISESFSFFFFFAFSFSVEFIGCESSISFWFKRMDSVLSISNASFPPQISPLVSLCQHCGCVLMYHTHNSIQHNRVTLRVRWLLELYKNFTLA